jgi:hypothetical protein
MVKHPGAERGSVLPPRRQSVVERSFAQLSRFRRLACDYERPLGTLAGLHFVACLMLHRLVGLASYP